jgi:hypothetical protein
MNIRFIILLAVATLSLTINARAQTVSPLTDIIRDMENATLADVINEASLQANFSLPRYRSTNVETVTFQGSFTTGESGKMLVIFSDDGCRVTIDGEVVHDRLNAFQHLPNLGTGARSSFHPLPFFFEKNRSYTIQVDYQNKHYTGNADIDGCTLFLFDTESEIQMCTVCAEGLHEFIAIGDPHEIKIIMPIIRSNSSHSYSIRFSPPIVNFTSASFPAPLTGGTWANNGATFTVPAGAWPYLKETVELKFGIIGGSVGGPTAFEFFRSHHQAALLIKKGGTQTTVVGIGTVTAPQLVLAGSQVVISSVTDQLTSPSPVGTAQTAVWPKATMMPTNVGFFGGLHRGTNTAHVGFIPEETFTGTVTVTYAVGTGTNSTTLSVGILSVAVVPDNILPGETATVTITTQDLPSVRNLVLSVTETSTLTPLPPLTKSIQMAGTSQTSFALDWTFPNPGQFEIVVTDNTNSNNLLQSEPTWLSVAPSEFEIQVTAFIPWDHIPNPEHPLTQVFEADGDVSAGPDLTGWSKSRTSFRIRQKVTIIPSETISASGEKAGTMVSVVGESKSYDIATSLAGNPPLVTAAAKADTVLGAPMMFDRGTATSNVDEITVSRINATKVEVTFKMGSGNPLVAVSPDIDWEITLTIDVSNPRSPKFSVGGDHDHQ